MRFTVEQVRDFRTEMFERGMAAIATKGADYNRDQQEEGDTLFNLKVCALLGVVDSPEQGILVRLSDKFMRLVSLCKEPGRRPCVKDESVLDTISDIHNYIDFLGLIATSRDLQKAVDEKNCAELDKIKEWPPGVTGENAGYVVVKEDAQ